MVRGLLSKGEKGSFVDNLPLPIEIESASQPAPMAGSAHRRMTKFLMPWPATTCAWWSSETVTSR
jgi:hypothetical protein